MNDDLRITSVGYIDGPVLYIAEGYAFEKPLKLPTPKRSRSSVNSCARSNSRKR